MTNNKSQIWVETAVYTLIGLTIIAIILSAATPQIQKIKDKSIIEQTITAMNQFNGKVVDVQTATGNVRIVYFKIAKGRVEIDPASEQLRYIMENTRLELSQPGEEIKEGNILIKTEEYGKNRFTVMLTLDYSSKLVDLKYNSEEEMRTLQAGSSPYELYISNEGYSIEESPEGDIELTKVNIKVG